MSGRPEAEAENEAGARLVPLREGRGRPLEAHDDVQAARYVGVLQSRPDRIEVGVPGALQVGVPGALRFDTRFFVAVMPPNQSASGHRRETVGGDWISPTAALDRFDASEWLMIFPTLTTLQMVAPYHTVDALFEAVSAGRHAMEMTPELHLQGMQYS